MDMHGSSILDVKVSNGRVVVTYHSALVDESHRTSSGDLHMKVCPEDKKKEETKIFLRKMHIQPTSQEACLYSVKTGIL